MMDLGNASILHLVLLCPLTSQVAKRCLTDFDASGLGAEPQYGVPGSMTVVQASCKGLLVSRASKLEVFPGRTPSRGEI
jgi:hypothetical protein